MRLLSSFWHLPAGKREIQSGGQEEGELRRHEPFSVRATGRPLSVQEEPSPHDKG